MAAATIVFSARAILACFSSTTARAEDMRAPLLDSMAPGERERALANGSSVEEHTSPRSSAAPAPPVAWNQGDLFVGVGGGNYDVFDSQTNYKETISTGLNTETSGCSFDPSLRQLYP